MAEKSPKREIEEAVDAPGFDTLPDAGWKRDEALKMRQDNLDQEAEELAERMLIGAIDKKYLEVDNEIAQRLDYLAVTKKRPDMHYFWANHVNDHGRQVTTKKMLGWEVVTGKGPDCPECTDIDIIIEVDGTRKIADVILMRIPREHALILKARERAEGLKKRGQLQNADYLMKLGNKHGVKVGVNLPDDLVRTIEKRQAARLQQAMNTVQGAYRTLGKNLEGGRTLPGMPVSG